MGGREEKKKRERKEGKVAERQAKRYDEWDIGMQRWEPLFD